MEDKPGINGKTFTIILEGNAFGLVEVLSEPEKTEDGWTYKIKDIDGTLMSYLIELK